MLKVNQTWSSKTESFKVIELQNGDAVLTADTDVKYLDAKSGEHIKIKTMALESLLKDEMKAFNSDQ